VEVEGEVPLAERAFDARRFAQARIAALAAGQHGVVTRAQLHRLGLSSSAVGRRAKRGDLHRVHRGVYAVGHPLLSPRGRLMAAVLSAGDAALISHRSAAKLLGLGPFPDGDVDVTATSRRLGATGVRIHRSAVAADERTNRDGIPVTEPMRTLVDLASVIGRHRLQRAADLAGISEPERRARLTALLERHRGRRGIAALREIVGEARAGRAATRSELEERFVRFIRRHGLPAPQTNLRVSVGEQRYELDAAWTESRLAVELDGYGTHSDRAAFERDRERDRRLQVAGWRVVRVTWHQLHDEPALVAAHLRVLLRVSGREASSAR